MTTKEVRGLIVLFGATGDLASRKLYPALFRLYRRGLLTKNFAVIGTARRQWTEDYYQNIVLDAIKSLDPEEGLAEEFATHFHYVSNDATDPSHYEILKNKMAEYKAQYNTGDTYLYYLSTAPGIFPHITKNLKETGIVNDQGHHRLVLEKPFGSDLASAEELNNALNISFDEDQIYRIDHYLGKEMVLNIIASRFYNPVLEKVWNKDAIENIQITLAEDMPVGSRGGYYDKSGAIRDMFQNHMLQIAAFVGMELPETLEPVAIHKTKREFLEAIPSFTAEQARDNIVRGQYGPSTDDNVVSFRDEAEVADDSDTETYLAIKLNVDTNRWAGVPFYFRTGKALNTKYTTVEIVLKNDKIKETEPSRLTFYIQPEDGLVMTLNAKQPASGFENRQVVLSETKSSGEYLYVADAYEKLFHQVFQGDATNFTTWGQLQQQWRIVDSIVECWKEVPAPDFPNYAAGSFGPQAADELLAESNHRWFNLDA